MPIIRAEFNNWILADQAIASVKKEAIPLHQIRISEHQSFASLYAAVPSAAALTAIAPQDSMSNFSSATLENSMFRNPILVEIMVESSDKKRVETLLHRWQPAQENMASDPFDPWH